MSSDPVAVLKALKASRTASARWRLIIALSVVAVFGVYGWCFYSLVTGFDSEKFAARFAERGSQAAPGLVAQTGEAMDRLIPIYSDEVAKQADAGLLAMHKKLLKEYEVLLKDVDLMTSQRSTKLKNLIHGRIDSALSTNYPVFAQNAELRGQTKDAILSAFEGAAQDALDARVKRPSNELKRLIEASSQLATQATKERSKQADAPELRMVIAMLGLVSRELANQRARLVEEAKQ